MHPFVPAPWIWMNRYLYDSVLSLWHSVRHSPSRIQPPRCADNPNPRSASSLRLRCPPLAVTARLSEPGRRLVQSNKSWKSSSPCRITRRCLPERSGDANGVVTTPTFCLLYRVPLAFAIHSRQQPHATPINKLENCTNEAKAPTRSKCQIKVVSKHQ